MKKVFFVAASILSFVAASAQSGESNMQSRKVPAFHGIEVSGGIDLYLSSGPASVAVSASSEAVRDHMVTEVENGILKIRMEDDWRGNMAQSRRKAWVSVEQIDKLGASGGSDVVLKNEMTAKALDIDLSGGSDLKGKLNADKLSINQSGGSDVDISGKVQNLNVVASGGSDLEGYDLVTDYANLNASGGSDSRLTVNKELTIMSSGASDVSYKGRASVKQIKTSGSSSVTHKD